MLRWAATLDRPLPWRGETDPYRILVSEVMLQQTQALRVVPHYERFLHRFPRVESLAEATAGDVLRAWENLGYNRRALNLWQAARAVVSNGGFPSTVDELRALPGVGPYTARALASFAFGVEVAAADVNVRRVVARTHGVAVERDVQKLADVLVPRGRVREWNQAMIDLGAEVCRARNPRCGECPVRGMCAWSKGVRPASKARRKAPRFEETTRYARGRIMQVLRAGDETRSGLAGKSGLAPARFVAALRSLEADGLISVRGTTYRLGVSERASADVRRR